MHPITAETPFSRLWPGSQRRHPQPRPARPQPRAVEAAPAASAPVAPAPGHDFLVANLRPDLVAGDTP